MAVRLEHLRGERAVVCGLPRGGVPVAFEVAMALSLALDVIVVRKLGVPAQPELAMGAVGEGGARFVDDAVVARAGLSARELDLVERRETAEAAIRAQRLRSGRPAVDLSGQTVVIVDDGVATGSSARAACQVARWQHADRVMLAVPVAPTGWTVRLADCADDYVSVQTPKHMAAVGHWYLDFSPTSEREVIECLTRAAARPESAGSPPRGGVPPAP